MRAVVLDTNVLSYILKGDTRAEAYKPHLEQAIPILSFQTLAELNRWPIERNWGAKQRRNLENALSGYQVVHSSPELCQHYARAMASAKAKGKPILSADAWVAAVALELNIPLVTHNPRDFAGVEGLDIITEMS